MTFLSLLLTIPFAAQALAQNTNLTFSFSPSTLNTCATNGSTEAVTFTTSSVPATYQCFNLEDLFSSSTSSSYGSRTTQSPQSSVPYEEIAWRLFNTDAYSNQLNYSRVWYQQQNVTSPNQGEDATRLLEVFSGRNCQQTNASAETVHPILGWTCQSSGNGDCYEAPYNIMSFQVGSAAAVNSQYKKCWTASTGMGPERPGSGKAAAAVGAVAILFAGILSW
ncbi:hypothetical protein AUEXF2481DRAFT_5249 [Aureobasidium subglaciale EXF-2481]|uniref:Ig-like domain-containing protein n=1 Tax=Aureobasidium subglaciale (strain EXF-2481) TaxID=1043005 RepID=A0A074YB54_AURSE|nr:uncharacterized protein AUEXF2481DRAFT_5249 [Aureobasidium subglaciale EXF-2481]KAI5211564.1 hypothetical protein E4T38_01162 [Aureobasidium subglaciale]KAI5230328.1 hypothetical protein E4T40_01163 [Aureobasidium subglaciale]KAI5233726.1 hypothetical protein E4T41_01161 [Aureobasidium subglaciale]KAI5266992.1 hypothetical protein E4T46_01161 [Aureobasidium subglaciale]KEQ95000.1 hypothetical protein AUEXF2481DRAFT_5249 [Aureobasidium subglaciale EXF-2481]